jgi:CubicO group peptidase (beta-lactamase class C family)
MEARVAHVEAVATRHVEAGTYSSVEWLALQEGEGCLRGSVGFADALDGVPLPDQPIYRLYSMTKPVISAIALMLVEEGRLRLYDPVAAYIPGFAKQRIAAEDGSIRPARRSMLVEHLMTHRAGLSYGFLKDCPAAAHYRQTDMRSNVRPLADMVEMISSLPLAFEPGEKWRYSVATDVLARVIEVVEGKGLRQIVDERIIQPLGLKDTGFSVRPSALGRLMPMFGKENLDDLMDFDEGPQKLFRADVNKMYPANDANFARGGYGLFSTIDDYAAIAGFLATGRSPSGYMLLSRMMTRFMWQNRIPESQMPLAIGPVPLPGYGFSLAGRVMVDLGRSLSMTGLGECGWSGAAGTFFWIDPEQKLVGLVMTQYLGSKLALSDEMRTAIYQAIE